MDRLTTILQNVLDISLMLIALALLVGIVTVVILYLVDVTQTTQAIRRNYPVIGRLRYVFEHLGVFFRQYFFAMDREELPFNRAQRSWIAKAAKNLDGTLAFGSTRPLDKPGDIFSSTQDFHPLRKRLRRTHQPLLPMARGTLANPIKRTPFSIFQPCHMAPYRNRQSQHCRWVPATLAYG